MIDNYDDTFSLLSHVENVIHVDVLKLYPEAELPTLKIKKHTNNEMQLVYTSQRKMAVFAKGIIEGCIEHFKEPCSVETQNLKDDETEVLFTIKKL